jgi:uncharacterized protein (TIGR03435 family)
MKWMHSGLLIGILLASANAQDATEFDVAIIKPTVDSNARGLIVHLPGERGYRGTNMPLMDYLRVAYQMRVDQITGPEWLIREHFDMEGKADRTCTADELHIMLQHLLEQRFHIKMHRETKQVSGYNLVVDTAGHKLADHDPADAVMLPIQFGPDGARQGKNVAMQYLAFYLAQEVGQPVVDQTGLKGHYDFKVRWGNDGPMPMPAPPPGASPGAAPAGQWQMVNPGPSGLTVFEALRKQLGLRLEKAKVPEPQLIIDHVEKLADN